MPRIYPTRYNRHYYREPYITNGHEASQTNFEYWARQLPSSNPGWTITPPSEPLPQPPSPPSDLYSELTASPPPSPPVRMRNLNSGWQVVDEVDYDQIAQEMYLTRTSSGQRVIARAGAGDSPVTPQTFKKEGNTFKKFIQKTMNTES